MKVPEGLYETICEDVACQINAFDHACSKDKVIVYRFYRRDHLESITAYLQWRSYRRKLVKGLEWIVRTKWIVRTNWGPQKK